ncbi:MAG: FecR domain-containing protein [Rhodoferax sp.]|nr:FecR domain-containing protein [Rhodoferax sp.]
MQIFKTPHLTHRVLQILRLRCALVASLLLGAVPMVWANSDLLAGRVAAVAGGAWLYDAETRQWAPLAPNQAVTQGDHLRTDVLGRVALHLGSTSAWLDEGSELEVLQFSEEQTLFRLNKGEMALRVHMVPNGNETRVQTREGLISAESDGLYRVGQLEQGSRLAVLQGRARFDADPARAPHRAWLRDGEQSIFGATPASNGDEQPLLVDRFHAWFVAQDRLENGVGVSGNAGLVPVPPGAVPLDQRGHWEQVDIYGRVWIPYNPFRPWVPLRSGHWVPWRGHWAWVPRPLVVPQPLPRWREHYFEPDRPRQPHFRPPTFNPSHREHPREERRSRDDPKPHASPAHRPEQAPTLTPVPALRDPVPPRNLERPAPSPRPQADDPSRERRSPEGKNREPRERVMER